MTERYLLEVSRYIELNPVRAEMVTDPGEYRWSSYQINALGKGVKYKKVMQASPNRRADTQVRSYRHIVNQKMGWVGADLCVCPVGGPAIVVRK